MPDDLPQRTTSTRLSRRRDDELGGEHKDALRILGYVLLRQGMAGDAIAIFRGLLRLDPNDRQARRALICAYLEADDPEHALEVAGSYVIRSGEPGAATVHLLRAQALWRLGQKNDAREALGRFIELRELS